MSPPAITVDGLTKRFGDRTAVEGVSLEVAEGEVFGYLGRNGSGKTTTVRMLTTLTRPTAGTASVGGVDIRRTLEVRRRIGVTLQEAALDPAMTARQHLALVAGLSGLSRRAAASRAGELLESFGLAGRADDKVGTFSGGMQRHLDIASALVTRPTVLFLDEPTTGLDPQSRRALWAEVRRLADGGVTVFLTTQYLEEADELATRLVIVDCGRVVAAGTPAELKAAHGCTTVTVDVDGPVDRLAAALAGGDSAGPEVAGVAGAAIESARPGRATVTLPADAGAPGVLAVLDAVRRAGPPVRHLNVAETSLEDVYLRLTGSAITTDTTETADTTDTTDTTRADDAGASADTATAAEAATAAGAT